MTFFYVISGFLTFAVAILGVLVFALARQIGLLHERIQPAGALTINQAIEVGRAAPVIHAATLAGDTERIGGESERSRLLMFVSPSCPMCKSLMPVVQRSAKDEADWIDVYYASDGEADHKGLVARFDIAADRYLVSEGLGRSYGVSKLPYAVLLGPDGKIRSMGLVNTREHIESLFNASETGVVSMQQYLRQMAGADGAR